MGGGNWGASLALTRHIFRVSRLTRGRITFDVVGGLVGVVGSQVVGGRVRVFCLFDLVRISLPPFPFPFHTFVGVPVPPPSLTCFHFHLKLRYHHHLVYPVFVLSLPRPRGLRLDGF